MTSTKQRGFSLLEMLTVVGIGFVVASIGFITMLPMVNMAHVDDAYNTTLTALRNTRNLAIAQSNEYYLYFCPIGSTSTNCPSSPTATIQVVFQPISNGVFQPPQTVVAYTLPPDMNFAVQAGFPNTSATVPDQFGTGAHAVDLGQGLTGYPLNYVVFYPDGSSRDNAQLDGFSLGDYNNGVIYLTRPTDTIYASRAISVMGATGRIRGWRLTNLSGVTTWVQQ